MSPTIKDLEKLCLLLHLQPLHMGRSNHTPYTSVSHTDKDHCAPTAQFSQVLSSWHFWNLMQSKIVIPRRRGRGESPRTSRSTPISALQHFKAVVPKITPTVLFKCGSHPDLTFWFCSYAVHSPGRPVHHDLLGHHIWCPMSQKAMGQDVWADVTAWDILVPRSSRTSFTEVEPKGPLTMLKDSTKHWPLGQGWTSHPLRHFGNWGLGITIRTLGTPAIHCGF